jgi:N-ethylmaleimide reductase
MTTDRSDLDDPLFRPLRVGAMAVPHRVWMAPLTRLRCLEPGDLPIPLMAQYYAQRAGAGLIVSEATHISPQAKGYAGAPGIYSDAQVRAWRPVTEAVHAAGGRIACQLWHVGRISHSSLQPAGLAPVAPSVLPTQARTSLRDAQGRPMRTLCSPARALEVSELPGIVDAYAAATRRARAAGFDAVEIHAANGYLLQQFLAAASNQRTDAYGGPIEARMRLLLEVVDACADAWSADRVGLRVSFGASSSPELADDAPEANALTVARALAPRGLAYLHLSEPDWTGSGEGLSPAFRHALREVYPGVLVGAGRYTAERARQALRQGWLDAVAFGRAYIANPDLPERFRRGAPLNEPDATTFYGGGAQGYTDYPFSTAVN